MTLRRIIILAGILLILFLAMYSWNQRTRALDNLAAEVGLELAGAVLKPLRAVQDSAQDMWDRYFDLVAVREENEILRQRVDEMEARLLANGEDMAELKRLRALIQLPVDQSWRDVYKRQTQDPVLTANVTGLVGTDALNFSLARDAGEEPGTYAINVTLGDNPNYAVAATPGVLTITAGGTTGGGTTDTPEDGNTTPPADPGNAGGGTTATTPAAQTENANDPGVQDNTQTTTITENDTPLSDGGNASSPTVNIGDNKVPLMSNGTTPSWALLNLILAFLTGIIMFISVSYTHLSSQGGLYEAGTAYTPSGDETMTAKWTELFTVSFQAAGGGSLTGRASYANILEGTTWQDVYKRQVER